jgi:hypothetical protein
MRIHWKPILITALWSELLLFAIYLAAMQYAGAYRDIMVYLDFILLMFLGGLWVARKVESSFVLHGVLVGIFANILFIPLSPLILLIQPTVLQDERTSQIFIEIIVDCAVKILGSTAGGYVGGRLSTKREPRQTVKS